MPNLPSSVKPRYAVVRVYIHVEDWDAPGYYVDIESSDPPTTIHALSSNTTKEEFIKSISEVAAINAQALAERLYDEKDPVYGTKEARR